MSDQVSDRDELAELISPYTWGITLSEERGIIDAVLSSGWLRRRDATTRAKVEALIAESQPMQFFGGVWVNGSVSVDSLCEAMGIEPPDPTPPPLTDEEVAQMRADVAAIQAARAAVSVDPGHEFIGVAGHPDDDECTHRADGTDATYCGQPSSAIAHQLSVDPEAQR